GASDAVLGVVAVEPCLGHALLVERGTALLGTLTQLVEVPVLDGLGGAGLGACRGEPLPEPVVAQRALLGDADVRGALGAAAALDHPVRAGGDAVPAAVAHVGLDDDGAELGAEQRPGGADVE